MKRISILLPLLLFCLNVSAETKVMTEVDKTYSDIQQTFGIVPTFLKNFPPSALPGAWMDMKGIQLNAATAIPGKYKELIGLAVAAQIPCRFCVYFHREAAQLNKATPQELGEAIAMAGSTRRWSTFLAGTQVSEGEFRRDVDRMMKISNDQKSRQAMEARQITASAITTPAEAYKDIEATIGFVPGYIKSYPTAGIVGAWREMKGLELNPNSAIPGKYKELIGLAVAAQTPCPLCVYHHTQSALTHGATKEEVNEAVAMAGIVREWSTVLNGQYMDEGKFRGEVSQIMKHLRFQMNKEVTLQQF